jgi:hypothetical protein
MASTNCGVGLEFAYAVAVMEAVRRLLHIIGTL